MKEKSSEVKQAKTMVRKDDQPGILSTVVRYACLIGIALFVATWSQGAFSAEPGSRASSGDKERRGSREIDGKGFENYYAVMDELACGDVKALAVRIRSRDTTQDSFSMFKAIDQRIYFIDKAGRIVLVRDSWDYEMKPKRIKSTGYIYPVLSWECTGDNRGKSYIIIYLWDGGMHSGAEWAEIYNLDGGLVASNYSEKPEDFRRINDLFEKKQEELGIHYDWISAKKIRFDRQNRR